MFTAECPAPQSNCEPTCPPHANTGFATLVRNVNVRPWMLAAVNEPVVSYVPTLSVVQPKQTITPASCERPASMLLLTIGSGGIATVKKFPVEPGPGKN